jgi:hypothetical protein
MRSRAIKSVRTVVTELLLLLVGKLEPFADVEYHRYTSPALLADGKAAALEINQLNEDCRFGIIETNQRELLCSLIILSLK